ncbi:MAG: amino acid racemase [Rickettsiales bacterium]
MKTIGLLGNASWPSTFQYYERINQEANRRLGGWHSAKIMLYGIDYHPIKSAYTDAPERIPGMLAAELRRLIAAGIDGLLICNNTLHQYFDILQRDNFYGGEVFHALRLTAEHAAQKGYARVLLLGTKKTMQSSFFKDYLAEKGVVSVVPSPEEMDMVQAAQSRLSVGSDPHAEKAYFSALIDKYRNAADAVVLGCTELPLAVSDGNACLPTVNPILLQCDAAVDFMLA